MSKSLTESRARQLSIAVAVVLSAPAVWQLARMLQAIAGRYDYPFDIDWLESPALYQAWRMMNGQFTYDAPERGYLPLFHPIGYPAILAAFGKMFGLDYAIARLLSAAALIATLAMGGVDVVRHASARARGFMLAFLGAGTCAVSWALVDGFFDMVRCDMISWMLCALAAFLSTREELTHRRLVWLAVVMTLGVYVRLLTVFPFAWVGLVILLRDRRAGIRLAVYVIGGCGLVLAGLQLMSSGWYFTYTVTMLQRHTVHADRIVRGMSRILHFLPFVPAIVVVSGALLYRKQLSHRALVWVGVFVMALPAALLPFGKDGGHFNDFMPVSLFIGPAFALCTLDLAKALERPRHAAWAIHAASAAMALFLLLRPFDVSAYVPSEKHWNRARALNDMVAKLEGGVVVPCHPFLPIRNGHRNDQYSEMPYLDAYWSNLPGLALDKYLEASDAEWILLTGFELDDSMEVILAQYEPSHRTPGTPSMVVGQSMNVRYVMQKKRPTPNQRVLFDFEDGAAGWTNVDVAFNESPTIAHPPWQNPIRGVTGQHLANSFHPTQGDRVIGTSTSPPFEIDRDRLALDLGGGVSVGALLLINGRAVAGVYPFIYDREFLQRATIDVTKYRGQKAQLRLFDDNRGSWGHLIADNVILFDAE